MELNYYEKSNLSWRGVLDFVSTDVGKSLEYKWICKSWWAQQM